MFIETHRLDDYGDTLLTFVKSSNVQVYPCGSRRGIVDPDGNSGTISDTYNIPFDPEARLNTEANNRKHSGLNGFSQSYLNNWDEGTDTTDGLLSLVLAGYLFSVKLNTSFKTPTEFGKGIMQAVNGTEDDSAIYANIRLQETPLFSGRSSMSCKTSVLRAQLGDPEDLSLDLLKANTALKDVEKPENFYFSGLSFSTKPIAALESTNTRTESSTTRDEITQQVFSLKILDKAIVGETEEWLIHEPAKLPNIEHGDTPGSIKLGDLVSNSINNTTEIITQDLESENISVKNVEVPADGNIVRGGKGLIQLEIVNTDNYYQLQFRNTDHV